LTAARHGGEQRAHAGPSPAASRRAVELFQAAKLQMTGALQAIEKELRAAFAEPPQPPA